MTVEQSRGLIARFTTAFVEAHHRLAAEGSKIWTDRVPSRGGSDAPPTKDGAALITLERKRQVEEEGWTAKHDSDHTRAELVQAAVEYATATLRLGQGVLIEQLMEVPDDWPWRPFAWKPSVDPIRNLVKAGALIAAEIDRLQRANEAGK